MAVAPIPAGTLVRQLRRLTETDVLADAGLLHRFATAGDEAAFAALVRRHGRLVWGVCRHVLGHEQDAEDAFQATFLVLARKAASVRKGASVGSWLHGVAYRTAMSARKTARRRRGYEQHQEFRPPEGPAAEASVRELRALLDGEVERLPEKLRVPFVLCCLEGKTKPEAAAELGWNEGTLSCRVAQARQLLRSRLARRGVTLSAALCAGALTTGGARAAVPAVLAAAALQGASAFRAGRPLPGRAVALAETVLHTATQARWKLGAALMLALGLLVSGAGLAAWQWSEPPAEPQATRGSGQPGDVARTDLQGDPLPAEAIARMGTVRFRHGGMVRMLAFSADGKQVLSHGWDGVCIWDIATGKELPGPEPRDWASGVGCLSPDGKLLALGPTHEGGIILREVATGKELRSFGTGGITPQRFSPDSAVLVSLGGEPAVRLWDVATGGERCVLEGNPAKVSTATFTGDGRTLAGGDAGGVIHFWDTTTGKHEREIAAPSVLQLLALSPDGALLATVGQTEHAREFGKAFIPDPFVRLWDVKSGKELRRFDGPKVEATGGLRLGFSALTFTPDGQAVLTGGPDRFVRLWDPATGKEQRRFELSYPPSYLAISPDGTTIAAAAAWKTIRLFDIRGRAEAARPAGHELEVSSLALTSDGRLLATAELYAGHGMLVWDPATGRLRHRLDGHTDQVLSMLLAADGRTLFTTGLDRTLRAWDAATGKELRKLPAEKDGDPHLLLAASPDGKTLAVSEKSKTVVLIDAVTGTERQRLPEQEAGVHGASFLPGGRLLVVWDGEHKAQLWDVTTTQQVRAFSFPEDPRAAAVAPRNAYPYVVAVSPDGRWIAYGSQDRYLALMDLTSGKVVRMIGGLRDGASALAFSPDSRTLAWGGWHDPTVRLVEVATGRERHRFVGHRGRILALAFSADGRRLLSGSQDTTALAWDLTGRLSGEARFTAGADLDACWAELAGDDAEAPYCAIRRLAADPVRAASYLGQRLRPVPAPDEKCIARFIADLDREQFPVRETATRELEALGETAGPMLRKALEAQPTAEAGRRLHRLLDRVEAEERTPSREQLRVLRALEVLELAGTGETRGVLEQLATGFAAARRTREARAALERWSRRGD